MADEEFLTVRDVARRLRMQPETVRVWLRDGRLRGVRLPADKLGWRIPESEVHRLLSVALAGDSLH
ncbi:MAG: helix-turn-helix domain-containing protein [Dehalococcoidia bacterium]